MTTQQLFPNSGPQNGEYNLIMTKRLVILSDMWGCKKGLWITSYLGYLQSYFDISFYDSRELGYLDLSLNTKDSLHEAFLNGGMDRAVEQLLIKEKGKEPAHYLTFCAGSSITWKAALKDLPIKSLYAISPFNLTTTLKKPDIPVNLLYGEFQKLLPAEQWSAQEGLVLETIPRFGHELYTDEKIIQKVCLYLLESQFSIRYKKVG